MREGIWYILAEHASLPCFPESLQNSRLPVTHRIYRADADSYTNPFLVMTTLALGRVVLTGCGFRRVCHKWSEIARRFYPPYFRSETV